MPKTTSMLTGPAVAVTMLALAAIVAVGPAAAQSAIPQPDLLLPAGTWQVDFEVLAQPESLTLQLPGWPAPRTYWYIVYRVTNPTATEVEFYPYFELFTDTFRTVPAGVGAEEAVFEAIRQKYRDSYPLLEPPSLVSGELLVGQDNARDSVAIFPQFDPRANAVSLFVSGLSNETARVISPVVSQDGTAKEYLLRKTLVLQYQVPGDPRNLENRAMIYRGLDWLMR